MFAHAGLDVEVAVPDPLRGDALAHLVEGTLDFALCPTNRLLVRAENGEDVIGVAAINHRGLETIQTVAGLGIERPRDLEGRRVAMNPTERGLAVIATVVAADGGNPEAVQIVDSGMRELSVDDIAAGEADATFGGYWAWDALFWASCRKRSASPGTSTSCTGCRATTRICWPRAARSQNRSPTRCGRWYGPAARATSPRAATPT